MKSAKPLPWRSSTIGDELALQYGKSLAAQNRSGGGVPVFGSNGQVGTHNAAAVKGPGIIVGRKGSVGEVVFSATDFWPIDTTYYVDNKKSNNWHFIYYFLLQCGLEKLNSHSAVPGLNRESAYPISMPVPLIAEQEKIAAVLWKLQRAIATQDRLIAVTRDLKQSAMQRLFTSGLRNEQLKDTEIGPIPASWRVIKGAQLFKLTSGDLRPKELAPEPSIAKPFPVLGGNGVMGYADRYLIDQQKTIVIGRVGEYCGATHFASGKIWITDNALYVKEWLLADIDEAFIAQYLAYFDLNRFKRQAGQPLVTQGIINELSFTIPELDEQRDIAAALSTIDHKLAHHQKKRAALNDLFQTLLHKLMTGEIRVADIDIDTSEITAPTGAST